MTHTQGPWQVNGSHIYGPDPHRELVAKVLSDDGRLVADRDILSASLDMLWALEYLVSLGGGDALDPARSAIAKARGGER